MCRIRVPQNEFLRTDEDERRHTAGFEQLRVVRGRITTTTTTTTGVIRIGQTTNEQIVELSKPLDFTLQGRDGVSSLREIDLESTYFLALRPNGVHLRVLVLFPRLERRERALVTRARELREYGRGSAFGCDHADDETIFLDFSFGFK